MDEMKDVKLAPLSIISNPKGNILHGMKKNDSGYNGFGEAYFSTIIYIEVKAWKKHTAMTLNLIVPCGEVKFVMYDDRVDSVSKGLFYEVNLSLHNYQRLTLPPHIWMGFKGIGNGQNIVLNVASIQHDPNECLKKEINEICYDWDL